MQNNQLKIENMAKFEIQKSKDFKFYWVLKANNGEIVLTSQMYVSKQGSQNGIQSCKNSLNDTNFKRLKSQNGLFYFNQIASNGEIIGVSETYVSSAGCEGGISTVKLISKNAIVVDLT